MGRIGLDLLSDIETIDFGKKIAENLTPNSVIALYGDLGAGKTTLAQGLAQGLGIMEPLQSPTFVLLNVFEGRLPLYHFDLYRLKSELDFNELGFQEYFFNGGVCVIEWAERIQSLLPSNTISIRLQHTEKGRRAQFLC